MTEGDENRKNLSKYKICLCIKCYEKLNLSLEHRRGETDIECSKCKKSFSIEDVEKFLDNLSDIIEGDCPNCGQTLILDASDRVPESKIKCSKCKESFYIDECENQKKGQNHLSLTKGDAINPKEEPKKKKDAGELSYSLAIISVVLYIIPCTSIFAIIGAPLALIFGIHGLKQEETSFPSISILPPKSTKGITISLVLIIIMIIDIYFRVQASLLKY